MRGSNLGAVFPVGLAGIEIGRGDGCTILVDSPAASRRHAEIFRRGDDVILRDLGSRNGTQVNAQPAFERRLEHGDRITIADTDLLFEREPSERESAALEGTGVTFDRGPVEGTTIPMPPPDLESWMQAAQRSGASESKPTKLERRSRALGRLMHAAGLEESPRSLLANAFDEVMPELMADTAVVFLEEEPAGRLKPFAMRRSDRAGAQTPLRVSSTVVNRVLKEGVPFLAGDAGQSLAQSGSIRSERIHSVMCAPLKTRNRCLGVFYVDVRAMPGFYDAEDLRFLATICSGLAANLENLQLYRQARESYQRLELATQQLAASEKMSALGRLSGLVAHELNNPFQAITLAAEMAQEELMVPVVEQAREQLHGHLETILQNMQRCTQLVSNLLHYSRKQPDTSFVPVDVLLPIGEALKLMRLVLTRRQIELVARLPRQVPPIFGCASELEQVFFNLVKNAADAIRDRGTITVEVLAAEKSLEIAIVDTGSGIRPEDMPHVFEELFTTKPIGEGTGLGLPLCKRIVERHGGTIEVSSRPGEGTSVLLSFPFLRASPREG